MPRGNLSHPHRGCGNLPQSRAAVMSSPPRDRRGARVVGTGQHGAKRSSTHGSAARSRPARHACWRQHRDAAHRRCFVARASRM